MLIKIGQVRSDARHARRRVVSGRPLRIERVWGWPFEPEEAGEATNAGHAGDGGRHAPSSPDPDWSPPLIANDSLSWYYGSWKKHGVGWRFGMECKFPGNCALLPSRCITTKLNRVLDSWIFKGPTPLLGERLNLIRHVVSVMQPT